MKLLSQKERTKKRKLELIKARIELNSILITNGKNPQLCEICQDPSSEDHHIIKKAEDNYKYNSDINNLIRLCRSCHSRFHSYDSNYLSNKNKQRFEKCLSWLYINNKFVTLSKFEKNYVRSE